ncbi:hypothetical protein HYV49_01100 [Candidatus Pacearchaeota archaeon]|nr:hypothetical protein [Candidatus Pacearchaeota archaeon]
MFFNKKNFKKKRTDEELSAIANYKIGQALNLLDQAYDIANKLDDQYGCGALGLITDALNGTEIVCSFKEKEIKNK